MLPNNFEVLVKRNPKYARTLESLWTWINNRRHDQVINPRKAALDLRGESAADLSMAFTLLLNGGLLHRVYKVLTPAGVFADDEFDDPIRIPQKLPDRFEHYFDTSDAEIVPVFRLDK